MENDGRKTATKAGRRLLAVGLAWGALVAAYASVRVALGYKFNHLVGQVDVYLLIACVVMTMVFATLLVVHKWQKRHWAVKLLTSAAYIAVMYVLIVLLAVCASLPEKRIWSNGRYVLYHERSGLFSEGEMPLYERHGLSERWLFGLNPSYYPPAKAELTIIDSLDLVLADFDWDYTDGSYVDGRKVEPYHTTDLYRLHDQNHYIGPYADSI